MTRSLVYEELLAFDGIEESVDRLFRAYLDAVLVNIKRTEKSDYWGKVREFRRKELDPGTHPKYPAVTESRTVTPAESEKIAEQRAEKKDLIAFLYWFDVRASFWSSDEHSISLENFPLVTELVVLQTAVAALEARLKLLEKILLIKPDLKSFEALNRAEAAARLKKIGDESTQRLNSLRQEITAKKSKPRT